ncbi:putative alpha/beta hydrolase fold protein [Tanacetum coccineum]
MKPDDWRFAKTFSPVGLLSFAVTIYEWLDVPLLKRYYNFGFDHFQMSRKHVDFWGLVDFLLGNAGPFASTDWVIPEVTIQGSAHINSQLDTFSDTYYFSYAVKATEKVDGKVVPKRIKSGGSWFRVQVRWICDWSYPKNVQPPYSEYRDEDWWDNDSQLNTISMTHPRLPSEHPLSFVVNNSRMDPEPGVWYCEMLEAYHAQFVLSIRTGTPIHRLYDTIFKRCRSLDMKRGSQSVT